jgi:hypothetical protein
VVPLRSVEAHLGDRRYSSYSFLTSALEGGERSASRPGRALPPGKEPPVPIVQEAGWAPEQFWTQRLEEKSCASVGDRSPAVQSVVRRYTDWATPAHSPRKCKWIIPHLKWEDECTKDAITILVGISEGKWPWQDAIKMNVTEIRVDWIQVAQDRDRWRILVNIDINLRDFIQEREFVH